MYIHTGTSYGGWPRKWASEHDGSYHHEVVAVGFLAKHTYPRIQLVAATYTRNESRTKLQTTD